MNPTRTTTSSGHPDVDELIDALDQPAAMNGVATDDSALRTIDLPNLLATKLLEPEFVVKHLFPRQALVLIGGDSGSGKSSFAIHSGLAASLGKRIGNRFAPIAGAKTLFLNAEVAPALMRLSVLQGLAGLGADPQDFPSDRFRFVGEFGFADVCFTPSDPTKGDCGRFERLLGDYAPDIVVFDTHRALFSIDDRDNHAVAVCLNWLKRLAIKYNCCIVVVHHMKKLGSGNNSTRERITGAAAFREIPGIVLSAVSEDGLPMTALKIDKTRFAVDDVQTGKQFAVDAIFEPPTTGRDGMLETIGSSAFRLSAPTWGKTGDERSPMGSTKDAALEAKLFAWAQSIGGPFTQTMLDAAKLGTAVVMRKVLARMHERGDFAKTSRPGKGGGVLYAIQEPDPQQTLDEVWGA